MEDTTFPFPPSRACLPFLYLHIYRFDQDVKWATCETSTRLKSQNLYVYLHKGKLVKEVNLNFQTVIHDTKLGEMWNCSFEKLRTFFLTIKIIRYSRDIFCSKITSCYYLPLPLMLSLCFPIVPWGKAKLSVWFSKE